MERGRAKARDSVGNADDCNLFGLENTIYTLKQTMTQQQRSSGTKLVPPPRDFVPQGELALRYQDRNKIQQSLLENNSEEDDSTQTGMSQHRQGSGGAQQSSASQNPLYKVRINDSIVIFYSIHPVDTTGWENWVELV